MADKIATRLAFGKKLAQIGEREDIIVLDADLSKSTMTCEFKNVYPERHINCGIAEASMVSTAAGLASCGKKVFAASFAMFAAGRAYEQVRNSIAYPQLGVCIAGTHAGLTVGEDGATHQCIEDVALMRAIPGMTVISPADGTETAAAVEAIANYDKPVYLRLGRLPVPIVFDEKEYGKYEIGKARVVKEGCDVTIIAAGMLFHEAMSAIETLEAEGISVRFVDMSTIKPIDEQAIIESVEKTGAVVVCEEHNVIGGLGSAVAEVMGKKCPAPLEIVGVEDSFGRSGQPLQLLDAYGMSAPHIVQRVKKIIARKK